MKKILYLFILLGLTAGAKAQLDRSVRPKSGPDPIINLTKPETFRLNNGLTVLVVENHKLPRVTFSMILDNPLSVEGNKKGVSDLASNMMGNGTSKISKDDFNEQLDYYGASVNFSIDGFGGNTLSRYFPKVLSLVAQGVLDPLFTEKDLSDERAKLLDNIKASEKSPQAIAGRVKSILIYGKNHPRGEYLSEATLKNVGLEDVKNYYKNYFVPGKAYLVVVGDVRLAEVKKWITDDFFSWKAAQAPVSKYTEPVDVKSTEIDFVDVPNAVQSEISLNNVVNLKMTDPDYFAALLANQILGSGEGRLFKIIREAHGWTYGAYSSIRGDKHTSYFSAYASVRNAVTDSAVVSMSTILDTIRTQLPSADELSLVKAKYIGNFVMNAEKPETVAGFAIFTKTQSLPDDFYKNYIKNINSVSLEQVQEAAKKYFLHDHSRIIVVGKAEEVLGGLEKTGIPVKFFDQYGNPVSR